MKSWKTGRKTIFPEIRTFLFNLHKVFSLLSVGYLDSNYVCIHIYCSLEIAGNLQMRMSCASNRIGHSSLLPYSAYSVHAGMMRRNAETVACCQRLHIPIPWREGFRPLPLLGSMSNR